MHFDNSRALCFLLHVHGKGGVAAAHYEVMLQLGRHGISISIGMRLERKRFPTETSVKSPDRHARSQTILSTCVDYCASYLWIGRVITGNA